jgi:hypothetical protein
MFRSGVLTTTSICLLLCASLVAPASPAAAADPKQEDVFGPPITPKLRQKLSTLDKTAKTAQVTSARVGAKKFLGPNDRASQFAARATTRRPERQAGAAIDLPARLQQRKPHLAETAKIAGLPMFVGRHGTGLGDIFENNSGEEPDEAQVIDDLPANIVGVIADFDDVDFYAITATSGEFIRVEVVADRIFGSRLDSFLYLVDDDEDVLATSDDSFNGSLDSFIDFRAPYTGIYFIGVTDSEGRSASDFDYVLSIAPSRQDVDEDESNDTTGRADSLALPATAFGRSNDDEDQDVFRFTGASGQALIVDIDADIFLSDMDPVVELLDSSGRFVFGNDDFDGRDSRFNIVLPYTGTYYLLVYDLNREDGSDGHYYSLNVSTQSAALAPRCTTFKTTGGRLRVVRGSNFDPSNGGSKAEIDAEQQPSFNVPARPTTDVRLSPTGILSGSDTITVVNPDGRRSNPIILR